MNLLTAYKKDADIIELNKPVIQLDGVGVQYRTPQERIPSLKEYAIQWVKGNLSYKSLWALRDISLKIHPGEVLGIIGPNGAGKSTLLKVVARVLIPTEGRVRIRGRISPLLELGAGFDPELTGRENIYLNGTTLGFAKQSIDNRFDRIVDFAGLKDFINAPVRTYSTGMVARLGFSVATDVRPEILIVDEILGVGDAEFQTKSFERIQSFQAAGTTILLVTHDLGRVTEMCSRVVWLDHGELVMKGDADSVTAHYLGRISQAEEEHLTEVQQTAAATDDADRWGSRRIEITGVRLTDANNGPRSVFHTGERLQIHIEYLAHEAISSPIFGVAIFHNDGLHITGPNTRFAEQKLPTLKGRGTVVYTIPSLPLLDGKYHITVAVTDWNDTEIFDYHNRLYPFRVDNYDAQNIQERYGLMAIGGDWHFLGEDFD
ncbi:MAG: ABC transporter ATP-binding protein [Chloroflexi bacterium]|nr:ABC transporter ATP-binding protein [Chloroflexota bacterium]